MSFSALTQKGQVTIPAALRNALGLHQGDQVKFKFDKKREQIIIEKHTQPVEQLFGMYSVKHSVSDKQIKQAIIKGATRAHRA
jgi:AbrB family looped-hinge helix DNA binding protein